MFKWFIWAPYNGGHLSAWHSGHWAGLTLRRLLGTFARSGASVSPRLLTWDTQRHTLQAHVPDTAGILPNAFIRAVRIELVRRMEYKTNRVRRIQWDEWNKTNRVQDKVSRPVHRSDGDLKAMPQFDRKLDGRRPQVVCPKTITLSSRFSCNEMVNFAKFIQSAQHSVKKSFGAGEGWRGLPWCCFEKIMQASD